MTEARTLRGSDWADLAEVLHGLTNVITVRGHYEEGHPAIARADAAAAAGFLRLFERVAEIVVALIDDEFVINERPLPELRARLPVLADAMSRHSIECLVLQHGMTLGEISLLARGLAQPVASDPAKLRDDLQAGLAHVLLRFVELTTNADAHRTTHRTEYLVPLVGDALYGAARAIAEEKVIDRAQVRDVARRVYRACRIKQFAIEPRAYSPGVIDDAAHAANVALMTGAMAMEAGYADEACVDAIAAAILHDIGLLFLPAGVRGVPEPLVAAADKSRYRGHAPMGACALLAAGCPSLWVSAALEHHRGVDGGGYPALESKRVPHEIVRMISLASFFDSRRTRVGNIGDEPEEALQRASALQDRYFGRSTVRLFLRALGVFPPGTPVELSNREIGIVSRADPADPLRPQVRLLFGDHAGRTVELRALEGVEDRHVLSIVRATLPPLAVREAEENEAAVDEWTPEPRRPPLGIAPPSMVPPSLAPPPQTSLAPPPAPSIDDVVALGALERVAVIQVPAKELPKLSLDPKSGVVLSRIDGVTPLETLLDMCGMPREEAARILRNLAARGIVAFE